jgi:signal transduction histidine kinase
MKPLLSEYQDKESLWALGRASVQIVHDLKNQLNGVKLYATFLRKRMEKSERPADEMETIHKLIKGLDRTADDLSMIVQYGQPLTLKKQHGVDLQGVLRAVVTSLNDTPRTTGTLQGPVVLESPEVSLLGEFDPVVLTDALKSISLGAMKMMAKRAPEKNLRIQLQDDETEISRDCWIEWQVHDSSPHDPFRSFAGSDEIRMSLAAKAIEAHGGSAEHHDGKLKVRLPLGP